MREFTLFDPYDDNEVRVGFARLTRGGVIIA